MAIYFIVNIVFLEVKIAFRHELLLLYLSSLVISMAKTLIKFNLIRYISYILYCKKTHTCYIYKKWSINRDLKLK